MDTSNYLNNIDQITKEFNDSFGSLSDQQLNFKQSPQSWSIAQILHHLIVINSTYFDLPALIRQGQYKTPWLGKVNFIVNFFGKLILDSVQPGQKRKTKTFPVWEPSYSNIDEEILSQFRASQEKLKSFISESQDLVDKGTVISSPANRNVVYKLSTAFEIIVAHERRHLQQAREVLKVIKSN
jgi:hypothetical protein